MKIEKGFRKETRPRKGVMKEKLPHNRKPSQMCQWGALESQRAP